MANGGTAVVAQTVSILWEIRNAIAQRRCARPSKKN